MKNKKQRADSAPVRGKPVRTAQRAHEIYDSARFFDRRIKNRVIRTAIDKMARPARSLSRSCRTSARAKAAYRLIGNYKLCPHHKRQQRVTQEQLYRPICQHAARACQNHARIFVVQDTTCFMFPTLAKTTGLGTADRPKEEALWMHSALALRPDGYVLGLCHAHFWTRPLEEFGKGADCKKRPFEEKESYLWVRTANAVQALFGGQDCPPEIVHIADRAGDVHEVLQQYVHTAKRFVIRLAYDRKIAEGEGYVRARLAAQPVLDRRLIAIPRTRTHPARKARVLVRSCRVTLQPPRGPKQPIAVNVVWVHEPAPPAGVERVDWVLYTSEAVATAQDCWEVVNTYKLRWRIEDFHRIVKSDCLAEKTQLKDVDSIIRLLAFLIVAAIRILQLRDLARTQPNEPCTLVLADAEWRALWLLVHEDQPEPGQPPPTMAEAVKMIGSLGGHLGRKGDGMPGAESLALGLKELEVASAMYRLLQGE